MTDTVQLLKDCKKLARTRKRMLCLFIFGDYAFAEERIDGKPEEGAAFEFSCKLDDLNDELVKYIESYNVKVREEVLGEAV